MSDTIQPPSFLRPPVVELVCGVQFDAIPGFSAIHFGRFAHRVAEEYPRTEDREPLAEMFERTRGAPDPKDDIVSSRLPPLRRVCYLDQTGNYLLQVQPSRFLTNWRREQEQDEYPRFDAAYAHFIKGWANFVEFARAEGFGAPRVNQYELTYTDHIYEGAISFPEGMQDHLGVFAWRNALTLKFLPAPETAQLRFLFALPDGRGNLHLTISHGQREADKKGVMVMDFTARGLGRTDWSDMGSWFTLAHEWIVKGFTDVTTPLSRTLHRGLSERLGG